MADNKQISGLPSSEINSSDDLFLDAVRISDNTFLSKKIKYGLFSDNVVNSIENLSSFSPTGNWKFEQPVGITTKTITEAVNQNISSCVVNIDYLSSVFTPLLNKLSSDFFSGSHIPSSVGEIIYSTKLKTEEMVKKHYGVNTSWQQIQGRFIVATGDNTSLVPGIRGGEEKHLLKINEIPPHNHEFSAAEDKKTLEASFTLESKEIKCLVAGEKTDDWASNTSGHHPASEISKEYKLEASAEKTIYGDNGEKISITAAFKNKSHNNMPPFYTCYIWKRTK